MRAAECNQMAKKHEASEPREEAGLNSSLCQPSFVASASTVLPLPSAHVIPQSVSG
jgi:hypothetical protein